MIGVERANHRQPTLQRLHEIRLTIGRHALHDRLAQRASRRNGWGRGGVGVSVDCGCCLEEAGEECGLDGVVVPAAGVDGEVRCCCDVAVFVVDGCGYGAEAVFELLVDVGEALVADAHELGAEFVGGVDGAGGDGGQLDGVEVGVEPFVGLAGEEDASEGGCEGGVAGADVDRDREDAFGGGVGDVDDVGAVEDGEGG